MKKWRVLSSQAKTTKLAEAGRNRRTGGSIARYGQLQVPRTSQPSDRTAHAVIGAAIEVHRYLGPGHLEAVYERAMITELRARGMKVERQVAIPLLYKGEPVGEAHVDLIVDELLIVELKAVENLTRVHFAQTVSYLRASNLELGLLINFNVHVLKEGIRRIVSTSLLIEPNP